MESTTSPTKRHHPHLYNANTSIGYIGEIWATLTSSLHPILWMTGESWESGLSDGSFTWTSKSLT